MGCVASKDGVETNRNSRSTRIGGTMSMPVQAQGSADNGYHMVALTSSTYGILKVDDVSSVTSSHDAFHEKLKQFDFPDEMHAKSWSEVSRALPKIPPPTRTGVNSPRLQTLGLDSPRQNPRGMDSPRLGGSSRLRSLPSQATRNNHDVINTWELMDGLDKDGNAPKKRVPASPSLKPFERSVTFSTIHTLSELDSGDPSMAIVTAPAVKGGKENRAMSRSASSPMVPALRLTPSSPSLAARMETRVSPGSDHSSIAKAVGSPKAIKAKLEAEIEAQTGVGGRQSFTKQRAGKVLSEPDSGRVPEVRSRSPESKYSKPPVAKVVDSPTIPEAGIEARGVIRRQSFTRQPAAKVPLEPDSDRVPEVTNRPPESKYSKPPMAKAVDSPTKPEARGLGRRQSFTTQLAAEPNLGRVPEVTSRPSESNHSKPPVVKAVDSPKALKTQLEAGVGGRQWQPAAEAESGRVQAAVMSLRQEAAVASPPPIPKRVEVDETSTRQVPRFASPIHVLSLAASFDLENLKNSRSQAAPSRRSLSNQQSMPSPSVRAIPASVALQSQASVPLSHGSSDELQNVRDSKGDSTSISAARPMDLDTKNKSEEGVSRDKDGQGDSVHLAAPARQKVEPDPWARFEVKCPPDGEDRVVLYTTSLRGIRKTFEDCNAARFIFETFNIVLDERDVSIHAEFRQELKDLAGKPVPVPQAFIKGRYIGGLDVISELHESGILATLVVGLPPQLSRGECDGCGGVRFVPCSDCSGSTKVVNDAKEVVRCPECNENGLMRCPICY